MLQLGLTETIEGVSSFYVVKAIKTPTITAVCQSTFELKQMNQARKELFGYSIEQFKARREWCFWPKEECTNKAIRAHSVQNSRVLDLLCRDGHLMMPQLDLTATKPPDIVFRPVGRNLATTFTGLCENHDRELFRTIETKPLQTADSQHLFLLSYRAVLMEAHASRKSAIDLQLSFQRGVERAVYPREEPSPPGELAVVHMIGAYLVEDVKTRFDKAYLIDDWDAVSHHVFFIESRPALAVNSMFSTNRYSEVLDAPAFVTLNVFPVTREQTAVVFSFIAAQKSAAVDAFGYIWSSGGQYQQYELSKLILRKAQNVAIAPEFFDTFTERRRENIRQYFMRNIAGHSFELEDPDLFLFWAIGE